MFIFLETYTRMFWSAEALYYNPIWHVIVATWESLVYNPILDLDRYFCSTLSPFSLPNFELKRIRK